MIGAVKKSATDQIYRDVEKHFSRDHNRLANLWATRVSGGGDQIWITTQKDKKWEESRSIRATWDGGDDKRGSGSSIMFSVVDKDIWITVSKISGRLDSAAEN